MMISVPTVMLWKNTRVAGRIAEVDGLRGLAILIVVVYHYVGAIGAPRHRLWEIVTRTTYLFWSGVDLFFVLSGFLIAGILIDSARSKDYFKTFYYRRIHRIFPLYFGWLALFYIGIYFNLDSKLGVQLFQTSVPLWLYPFFLQNNAPLWFNVESPPWMAMSWSLAVEEQFYVILPSIVRVVTKPALACLCAAVILLSPVYRFVLVAVNSHLDAGWVFSTLSRLDGLAMGVTVALLVRNQDCWMWLERHPTMLRLAGMLLLLAFVGMTYFMQLPVDAFTVVAVFYAVILLLAICQPTSRLSALLRTPTLQYFGKVSYAIYILHQGVHALTFRVGPTWAPRFSALRVVVLTTLSFVVTILLAELSWHFVESRLIRRAHIRYKY